jgi:hypothetical protein
MHDGGEKPLLGMMERELKMLMVHEIINKQIFVNKF